jgi:hypothetical protein
MKTKNKFKNKMENKSCRVASRTPKCDNCRAKEKKARVFFFEEKGGPCMLQVFEC